MSRYTDLINQPIYTRDKIEVRYIDVLLALFAVFIGVFYLLVYSWQWAVLGVLTYAMIVMATVWLF